MCACAAVDATLALNDNCLMVKTPDDPPQAVASRSIERPVLQGIRSFQRHLATVQTPTVSRIILYGSYARGDYWEESDVDLAVVFTGQAANAEERMRLILLLSAPAAKVRDEMPVLISPMAMWESDLKHPEDRVNPAYYRNVVAEGLPIDNLTA